MIIQISWRVRATERCWVYAELTAITDVFWPFIPGVSKRKYTDEWLAEQNRKENEKKEFRGKEYDTYAALQYQRKLERVIRKQKQDIKLLEKGGADKDDLTTARCRKRLTEKTYTEFSKAMDLRQQRERLKVGEANPTKEELEAIEKRKRIAIIKSELKELGFRGKINLEIRLPQSHWL